MMNRADRGRRLGPGNLRRLFRWAGLALLAIAAGAAGCRSAQPATGPAAAEENVTTLVQRWPNGRLMTRREVLAGATRSDQPGSHAGASSQSVEKAAAEPVDHGVFAQWFPDGTLQYIGRYRQGRLHGIELQWHDNGRPAALAWYADGQRQGLRRTWNPDGKLVTEESYLDDRPHGTWSVWEPSGRLKWQGRFDRGEPLP